MTRAYNFGAGPAVLPEAVLLRAKDELMDWNGTGVSVMEIGHRTKPFQDMLKGVEIKLRKLMNLPDNYKVLFLTGGGQGMFSLIPMNLTARNTAVDYLVTGIWSERAAKYAKRYAEVNIATLASASVIPDSSQWKLNPQAKYAYYCHNESINGIRFAEIPDTGNVPLVSDMTSCILTEDFDISKFGIVFAAAQKCLGIAGITLMLIRDDLLDEALDSVPEVLNFKTQVANNSCLNTVPTFAVYMMDLMVDWVIDQGGVPAFEKLNKHKAAKLYQCIDQSGFYANTIEAQNRSFINVPFTFPEQRLLDAFLVEADQEGLKFLSGHASVGGARASLYNAMPEAGVDKLIDFMQQFCRKHS